MAKPEHVEQLESGGLMCRHCGGAVDGEGYSAGGDVQDGDHDAESEVEAMQEGDTGEMPQQLQADQRLLGASGFADAVKRRRRD